MTERTEANIPMIGQYIDTYLPAIDGVIMTVHNYARWLNEWQYACYVATAAAPDGYEQQETYPVIRYRSLPIAQRPPYRYGVPLLDRRFMQASRDMHPDLVHAHSPFPAGQEARRIARKHRIPLVASFHSKYYDDILQATGSKFLAEQAVDSIIRYYHKADYVWTVNQGTARTLRDYGFRKAIEIMPNGTDLVLPEDPVKACRAVDRRFGLSVDDRVMLFVGQHIVQKNLPMLLQAARLYAETGAPFKLLMVGDGQARNDLQHLSEKLGLADRVVFVGVEKDRARLTEIYLRADLFVFPSVYDNAPLVVREAASARCPAVLIAGSNAAEAAQDGVNAYLCDNSPESLGQAMQRAFHDEEKRKAIGAAAGDTLGQPWQNIIRTVGLRYQDIIWDYRAMHKMKKYDE